MAFGIDGGTLIPGEQLVGFGSTLTIEELTPGAGAGKKLRKLILRGPALPFTGATWGFTNQIVTTWYPGNAEATQQNLGPRETPSSWEGEWNRTRMGRTPSQFIDEDGVENTIVSPDKMRDIVESIGRGGARLRVTWAVTGREQVGGSNTHNITGGGDPASTSLEERNFLATGKASNRIVQGSKLTRVIDSKIVREGRIKSASFPHDRHTDIRWTIEFEWVSRGETQSKVAKVGNDNDLSTAANSAINNAAAFGRAFEAKIRNSNPQKPKTASRFTLGQLEAIANTPSRLVDGFTAQLTESIDNVKRIGDVSAAIGNAPDAIANTLTGFARNTVATTNRFLAAIGAIPAEKQCEKSKVSAVLRTTNYIGEMHQSAVQVARSAQALDASLQKTEVSGGNRGALTIRESTANRASNFIAVYIAKAGDTPGTVSSKFYKSPDHGVDILRANRMPWHTPSFRPGQIVVIPVLNNASRSV